MAKRYGDRGSALSEIVDQYGIPDDIARELEDFEQDALDLILENRKLRERNAALRAEHEQMGRALAGMITDHPFDLDGGDSATTAAWFIHEATNALGPAPSNG